MHTSRLILSVLGVILLSGCASNVIVDGDVPKPLMQRLPVTAKLNFSEEFSNYSYIEEDKDRAIKSLDFGAAQTGMFKQVFGSAFTLLNSSRQDQTQPVDVVITPKVLSVQYSAPRETALNIYEVSLKYRITLTGANDENLADWVIKGYGKTPTAFLKGADAAFNAATNVALRDVGAQISIGLPLQSRIQELVKSKARAQTATLPLETPDAAVEPSAAEPALNSTEVQ